MFFLSHSSITLQRTCHHIKQTSESSEKILGYHTLHPFARHNRFLSDDSSLWRGSSSPPFCHGVRGIDWRAINALGTLECTRFEIPGCFGRPGSWCPSAQWLIVSQFPHFVCFLSIFAFSRPTCFFINPVFSFPPLVFSRCFLLHWDDPQDQINLD